MHPVILQELAAERIKAMTAGADDARRARQARRARRARAPGPQPRSARPSRFPANMPARSASWPMARVAPLSHAETVPTARQGQDRALDVAPPLPADADHP
jgi:hypothetical protein